MCKYIIYKTFKAYVSSLKIVCVCVCVCGCHTNKMLTEVINTQPVQGSPLMGGGGVKLGEVHTGALTGNILFLQLNFDYKAFVILVYLPFCKSERVHLKIKLYSYFLQKRKQRNRTIDRVTSFCIYVRLYYTHICIKLD